MGRNSNTRLAYSTEGPPPKPDEEPEARAAGGIRIGIERRASDRLVTLVTGLPGTRKQLRQLARELRTACGTGGTVKDDVVELRGDQRQKVQETLAGRGLKSKLTGGTPKRGR